MTTEYAEQAPVDTQVIPFQVSPAGQEQVPELPQTPLLQVACIEPIQLAGQFSL